MSLKKLIALGCALVLTVAALAACGGNTEEEEPSTEATTEAVEVQTEEATEEVTEEATEETTEEVVATDAE